MLKGDTTHFQIDLIQELEVIALLNGGPKCFPGGGGAQKVLPCLEGVGGYSFGPTIFPFCNLPTFNDRSPKGEAGDVTRFLGGL